MKASPIATYQGQRTHNITKIAGSLDKNIRNSTVYILRKHQPHTTYRRPEHIEVVYTNSISVINKTINLMLASSRASVLSTHADTPPVTKTTMGTNLLHPLNIITQLSVEVLGKDLLVLSSLEILLPVKEPKRNLELAGVLNDGNELFDFISGQFSGTFVDINFGLLADKVGETASETLNLSKAEDDVSLALNVSVENTQDVLEFVSLHHRHTPEINEIEIGQR